MKENPKRCIDCKYNKHNFYKELVYIECTKTNQNAISRGCDFKFDNCPLKENEKWHTLKM